MATTVPDTIHESADFSPYRPDGKLYGFVCIVTAATQPVGRAIVGELAAHGAACIYACSSTPEDDFAALEQDVNTHYPNTKVIGYPLFKLADEQDTLALIDDVLNAWGRLDVYVTSSSGLLGPASIADTTPADLQKLFEANSMAPFFALKYAPPAMRKTTPKGNYANATAKDQAYGSIIVISSVASTTGACGGPAFTMASHAALGVVRSGVVTLKGTGIRINCISPGQVDENDSLQSKEVAKVAGFFASGFSSYVTGANMIIDGGLSVMQPVSNS